MYNNIYTHKHHNEMKTVLILAILLVSSFAADYVIAPCINLQPCRAVGCTTTSNMNDCIVTIRGVNITCINPPAGYANPFLTCKYTRGCNDCRPNSRFNTPVDCTLDVVPLAPQPA